MLERGWRTLSESVDWLGGRALRSSEYAQWSKTSCVSNTGRKLPEGGACEDASVGSGNWTRL